MSTRQLQRREPLGPDGKLGDDDRVKLTRLNASSYGSSVQATRGSLGTHTLFRKHKRNGGNDSNIHATSCSILYVGVSKLMLGSTSTARHIISIVMRYY